MRNVVALNRDYCLLLGQSFFLTIVGLKNNSDATTCALITFVTHYMWMAVFAWTGTSQGPCFLTCTYMKSKYT